MVAWKVDNPDVATCEVARIHPDFVLRRPQAKYRDLLMVESLTDRCDGWLQRLCQAVTPTSSRRTRMHQSSYDEMQDFRTKYLTGKESENLVILDIGSFTTGHFCKSL